MEEGSWGKEIWNQKIKDAKRATGREIREFKEDRRRKTLEKIGWSTEEMYRKIRQEGIVWREIEERQKDIQRQWIQEKLNEGKSSIEYKELREIEEKMEEKNFQMKEERRKHEDTVIRFRVGNKARANEHWRKTEEKRCRLCGKEKESMKHIFEKCEQKRKENGQTI